MLNFGVILIFYLIFKSFNLYFGVFKVVKYYFFCCIDFIFSELEICFVIVEFWGGSGVKY